MGEAGPGAVYFFRHSSATSNLFDNPVINTQHLVTSICVFFFQVLDLLWSLSHLPSLTTDMVDQALRSHIEILSDSYAVKEQIKKNYAVKCVEDIRKGVLIVPAIRQLLKITRGMVKQQFNKHDKVWHLFIKVQVHAFFGTIRCVLIHSKCFTELLNSAFCVQTCTCTTNFVKKVVVIHCGKVQ